MSENFLQILLYLFGHYVASDLLKPTDPDSLLSELTDAGFSNKEAKQALEWLAGTKTNAAIVARKHEHSLRLYTPSEMAKLDVKARGYLLFLEQTGVLDGVNRERIIDRAMALEYRNVGLLEIHYLSRILLKDDGAKTDAARQMRELLLSVQGTMH